MSNLMASISAAMQSKSKGPGKRKIIIFNNQASYHECISYMKKHRMKPVKQISSARMVCIDVKNIKHLRSISHHPSIRHIESDIPVRTHGFVTKTRSKTGSKSRPAIQSCRSVSPLLNIPWNVRRIRAPKVWPRSLGQGIRIAIIDTGVGPNPDLKVAGGINTIDPRRSFRDDNGHGTFVAGITAARGVNGMLLGAAPRAKLFAVKALDANGNGFVSDIIEGVEWAIQHRMQVINMSFGLDEHSDALHQVLKKAYRRGITLVASAGNAGIHSGGIDEPAKFPEVIAVASSNRRNQISDFSSRGRGIDVTAPGEDIVSLAVGTGTTVDSGTSFACPLVAGSSALLLRLRKTLTPRRVRRLFNTTAVRLPGFSRLAQGNGLVQVNRAAFLLLTGKRPPAKRLQRHQR